MAKLSAAQIAQVAAAAGFQGKALVSAVSVALAESGGVTTAVGVNSDSYRSRDRGLWQINDHWHPEVSDAQAFDPAQCARAAFSISSGGRDWSPWSTWPTLAAARRPQAAAGVNRGRLSGSSVSPAAFGLPDPGSLIAPFGKAAVDSLAPKVADVAAGAVSGVTDSIGAARQALFIVTAASRWIANPHNWLRVGYVLGGAAAALAGLYLLARSGTAGGTAQGAARTVKAGPRVAASVATRGVVRPRPRKR